MLFTIIYLVFLRGALCGCALSAFINAHQPKQVIIVPGRSKAKHQNGVCSNALMCQ
ncbi:hypothetical protein QKT50_gp014 [Rachiplusia ou multiple nucleopolyhedrovirus]|uniref:Uncharacterized protein n=1 Tax=Rachiplusia ou multiple nucleopolyhedrovirus (strain R1) TaxID=654904 RepID=Q8B9N3_NPVR1|nr:hypothetical protein QKT50_gp014 [Rachiplusia ou multiple nucleopolyhedrovirus]AAN28161.1 unknown [Rachiplusia ou multiple nucleopolyhedrovirus]